MGLQEALARALSAPGLLKAARMTTLSRHRAFSVLAYHRVLRRMPDDSWPFDPGLISADEMEFDWQMRFLRSEFHVMALSELLTRADESRPLPPRAVAITFDDGFSDNYHVALEVLERHGLPATLFVSTEWVDRQAPIWFELCSYACMTLPVGAIVTDLIGQPLPMADDIASRRRSTRLLLSRLKRVPNDVRLELVDEIRRRLDTERFEMLWRGESAPLIWDEVRAMRRRGVEIGSHAVSHPILSQLSDAELDREVTHSRERLQIELGEPIDLIAYPVGGHHAYDARVVRAARRAGYRYGVSYIPGTNLQGRFDGFGIRRQHVELGTSRARFEALLSMPSVFT